MLYFGTLEQGKGGQDADFRWWRTTPARCEVSNRLDLDKIGNGLVGFTTLKPTGERGDAKPEVQLNNREVETERRSKGQQTLQLYGEFDPGSG